MIVVVVVVVHVVSSHEDDTNLIDSLYYANIEPLQTSTTTTGTTTTNVTGTVFFYSTYNETTGGITVAMVGTIHGTEPNLIAADEECTTSCK